MSSLQPWRTNPFLTIHSNSAQDRGINRPMLPCPPLPPRAWNIRALMARSYLRQHQEGGAENCWQYPLPPPPPPPPSLTANTHTQTHTHTHTHTHPLWLHRQPLTSPMSLRSGDLESPNVQHVFSVTKAAPPPSLPSPPSHLSNQKHKI